MNPNPQKQNERSHQRSSQETNSASTSANLSKFIVPGMALIAVLAVVQGVAKMFQPALPLRSVELNPTGQSQKAMQTQAPRYGLEDIEVDREQVYIILRDNGAEDGDYVTLYVNGQAYTPSTFIRNAGNSVLVPLNPGANLVQIRGDRDGGGGVTLAADVSNQGNMTNTPFPEGATAQFYIIRK